MSICFPRLLLCPTRHGPQKSRPNDAIPCVDAICDGIVRLHYGLAPGPTIAAAGSSQPMLSGSHLAPLPSHDQAIRQHMMSTAGVSRKASLVWHGYNRGDDPLLYPSIPMCFLRAGLDVICLPHNPNVRQFWAWAAEHHGYEPWQVVWYALGPEEHISREVLDAVEALALARNLEPLIIPYRQTKTLALMARAWGLPVFGDVDEGLPRKDCLHPLPENGPASVADEYLHHPVTGAPTDVRVPKGFRCETRQQLQDAYAALARAGVKVVLKPSWGDAGHGIEVGVSNERVQEYTWDYSKGSVVLEEMLDIDRSPPA